MNSSPQSLLAIHQNLNELELKISQALSYLQIQRQNALQPQPCVEYLLDIKATISDLKANLQREPGHALHEETDHKLPDVITINSYRAYETCRLCYKVLPELQRSDMRQRNEQNDRLASAICHACLT